MEGSNKQKAEDFLMFCSYYRRILKGAGSWEKNAESYLESNSSGKSHGICPGCLLENSAQE